VGVLEGLGSQLRKRHSGGACGISHIAVQSCERDALANGKFQIGCIVDCQSIPLGKREDLAKCGFVRRGIDTDGKREQISEESSGFVLTNPRTATRNVFATSTGQCCGTTAVSPDFNLASKDSVQSDVSSSKHHASVAEASGTKTAISTCVLRGSNP
jgi:hypothetical protein